MLTVPHLVRKLTTFYWNQRICWSPTLFWTIRNMLKFLRCGVDGPSSKPQAEGPPFVGCPGVLIQYIRGHPPYLETISSTRRRSTITIGGGRTIPSIPSHINSYYQYREVPCANLGSLVRLSPTIAEVADCTLKDTCWKEKTIMHWHQLRRLRPSVGEHIKWQVSGRRVQK